MVEVTVVVMDCLRSEYEDIVSRAKTPVTDPVVIVVRMGVDVSAFPLPKQSGQMIQHVREYSNAVSYIYIPASCNAQLLPDPPRRTNLPSMRIDCRLSSRGKSKRRALPGSRDLL